MPEPWTPGGDFGSPTYSVPIRVVDYARSTFTGERRKRWKESCALALERWGLPIAFEVRAETSQAYLATAEAISRLSVNPLVIPDAIVLVREHSAVAEDSAGWIEEMGGGIALITPWRGWWEPFPATQVTSVIAHEFGHTLGFGHGGTGVMSGAGRPNDQERALAAAYYNV